MPSPKRRAFPLFISVRARPSPRPPPPSRRVPGPGGRRGRGAQRACLRAGPDKGDGGGAASWGRGPKPPTFLATGIRAKSPPAPALLRAEARLLCHVGDPVAPRPVRSSARGIRPGPSPSSVTAAGLSEPAGVHAARLRSDTSAGPFSACVHAAHFPAPFHGRRIDDPAAVFFKHPPALVGPIEEAAVLPPDLLVRLPWRTHVPPPLLAR